jgi:membrane protein involved in colicin uptake
MALTLSDQPDADGPVSPPPIGHNEPPLDLHQALDPDVLRKQILRDYANLTTRRDELLAAFERFKIKTEKGIADDDTQGKGGDFIRQIKAAVNVADTARELVKKPILEASRLVDGHFKRELIEPMERAATEATARLTTYAKAKAEKARALAQAEAKRIADEAAALALKAARDMDTDALDAAIAAEEQAADAAAAAAKAPTAELSRVRSDYGSAVSLGGTWTYEVTDKTLVPREYLMVNDAMVKAVMASDAAVKKAGAQPIPGVRFYKDEKARVR